MTITVSNDGSANLTIGTISLSGTDTSQFSIQNDNASGQTDSPGNSATLQVGFSPTSDGIKLAALSIPSSDPDEATVNVSLNEAGMIVPVGVGGEVAPAGMAGLLALWVGLPAILLLVAGAGGLALRRRLV